MKLLDMGAVPLLRQTFNDWMEDKALRLSAALAYYSIFSIAPLLVISIGVAGLVLGAEAVNGQLQSTLSSFMAPVAAQAVEEMVKSAAKPSEGGMAAVFGFVTLLIGASGVFGELKDALNSIWEVKQVSGSGIKGFLRERLLSFGMVLAIGFLLLASLVASSLIAGFSGWLEARFALPGFLWNTANLVISIAIATVLFALIFKVLPDAKIEWRSVWVGAVLTALLFEIGKFALSYYLGRAATSSSYGAASSIVLLLLWIYYASCILFFGAEFTQVYARAAGHECAPAPGAVVGGKSGLLASDCRKQPIPEPSKERPSDALAAVEPERAFKKLAQGDVSPSSSTPAARQ